MLKEQRHQKNIIISMKYLIQIIIQKIKLTMQKKMEMYQEMEQKVQVQMDKEMHLQM